MSLLREFQLESNGPAFLEHVPIKWNQPSAHSRESGIHKHSAHPRESGNPEVAMHRLDPRFRGDERMRAADSISSKFKLDPIPITFEHSRPWRNKFLHSRGLN